MSGPVQCEARSEKSATSRGTIAGLIVRLRADDGAFMIEMALGFMVMMTMLLGIMECCMMAYNYSVLSDAAREGVRYATLHGTNSSSCQGPSTGCDSAATGVTTDVTTYANTFAGNLSNMTVTVTYPDSSSAAPNRVQVTVQQTYQPVFHYPGMAHLMTATSAGRILY